MTVTSLKTPKETTLLEESIDSMENLVTLYKSCDELPVILFYQILEKNDLGALIKPNQKEKPSEIQLKESWIAILDEYWQKVDQAKYQGNIRKSVSLLRLKNEYTTLKAAVIMYDYGYPSGIETMKYFKRPTVQAAKQRILVLKTQIALKVADNERKQQEATEYNIWKDFANLGQVLNRDLGDINKIVVSYWIELNKIAKQKQKAQTNGRNKQK